MWRGVGYLLLLLAGWAGAAEKYPIAVVSNKVPGGYEIVVRNPGAAVVSLWVDVLDGKNIKSDSPFPRYQVVQPKEEHLVLATITPLEVKEAYRFKLRWRWTPGDTEAQHDPQATYRLPFADGLRLIIGQAPGGPMITHTGPESANAVDIPMPEGTPIVAARDGLVVNTETGYSVTSRHPDAVGKANAIRLLHADGTLATYSHLKPGGVLVKLGDQVKAGELIGRSGSTGYSSGPHLHFAVFKPVRTAEGFAQVSLPFRFTVGNPPLVFTPEYGLVVEAEYGRPVQPPAVSPNVRRYSLPAK